LPYRYSTNRACTPARASVNSSRLQSEPAVRNHECHEGPVWSDCGRAVRACAYVLWTGAVAPLCRAVASRSRRLSERLQVVVGAKEPMPTCSPQLLASSRPGCVPPCPWLRYLVNLGVLLGIFAGAVHCELEVVAFHTWPTAGVSWQREDIGPGVEHRAAPTRPATAAPPVVFHSHAPGADAAGGDVHGYLHLGLLLATQISVWLVFIWRATAAVPVSPVHGYSRALLDPPKRRHPA
jgi:hypothetical protein